MSIQYLRAPGKAMWFGEYVVLDGAPGLVAAVDRHASCAIDRRFPDPAYALSLRTSISETIWRIPIGQKAPFQAPCESFRLLESVFRTLQAAGIPLRTDGADIRFSSEALNAETKLGLGSSAAIAALAVVALQESSHLQHADSSTIHALAHQAHLDFQGGVGSGSDIAAACYGGLLRMERGKAPRRIEAPLPQTLVIYTGQEANTRDFVRRIHAQRGEPAVAEALQTMHDLAFVGAAALEAGDHAAFLDHVRRFHRAEVALTAASGVPVVTPDIAHAVQLIEQCGGAGKASGAGGGDILIGFFEDRAQRDTAISLAVHAGLDVIPLAVEAMGVLDSVRTHETPLA